MKGWDWTDWFLIAVVIAAVALLAYTWVELAKQGS